MACSFLLKSTRWKREKEIYIVKEKTDGLFSISALADFTHSEDDDIRGIGERGERFNGDLRIK